MDGEVALQGTSISNLGKRKIIFKSALGWEMLISKTLFYLGRCLSTKYLGSVQVDHSKKMSFQEADYVLSREAKLGGYEF